MEKKKLTTLDEWNWIKMQAAKVNDGNGIACPHCGEELHDDGNTQLLSDPPQIKVMCHECGYVGTRLA